MIEYFYEVEFMLEDESIYTDWIQRVLLSESHQLGEINYIFCNDDYLHKINVEFLDHDTYTDIISFDNSTGKEVHGDIFISIERVKENAIEFEQSFTEELKRVMIHGILHYCGYKDKTSEEATLMRKKEEEKIAMFHVEQKS